MNKSRDKLLHYLRNLLALGCVAFLVLALVRRYSQTQNVNTQDALRAMYIQNTNAVYAQDKEAVKIERLLSKETNPLKEINEDYRGWLTVYGTEVDMPVVQAKDNTYYLSRDVYNQNSPYGALFLDELVDLETEGNALIYGHNFRDDKTMFSSLLRFKNEDFFNSHNVIRWEWGGAYDYYEIFAAAVIPGVEEEARNYLDIRSYVNVLSAEQVKAMVEEINNRAQFRREITLGPEDRFLFLCTCDRGVANNRLLLCAKKIVQK